MNQNMGQLFLVSTPIGNLKDITFRALETLKMVDEIICESPQTVLKLLNHYSISKPLIQMSEKNEPQIIPKIIDKLKKGKNLALVSDAGTPIISDPGQFLVSVLIKENIKITPIPGPSAVLPALAASGFSTQPFLFLGFLPKKFSEKRKLFLNLKNLKISKKQPTIIFFESPNRLIETLEMIEKILGEKTKISIAREMTKVFEEFIRGEVKEILQKLKTKNRIKGEITVCLSLY